MCLQEIKCVDDAFPREAIEASATTSPCTARKAFNGVALLSKLPFDEVAPGLIGDDGDVQARFFEAGIRPTGALRVGLPLSAQRQSRQTRKNIRINSNGWIGLLLFHVNG